MARIFALGMAVVAALVLPSPTWGQGRGGNLVSPLQAGRLGLERAWFTHVEVDAARGRIGHITQHVNSQDGYTVFEVHADGGRRVVSERDLDRSGVALGKEGARKLAERVRDDVNLALVEEAGQLLYAAARQQAEPRAAQELDLIAQELRRASLDELGAMLLNLPQRTTGHPAGQEVAERLRLTQRVARLTSQIIPEIHLYVMTDRAVLHAIDAETGRTLWSQSVGSTRHPSEAPAANDQYVAAVNGSNLSVLDKNNGKLIWQRQLRGSVGAGPAVSERYVFVPMISGTVEAYDLQEYRQTPWVFQSHGRAMTQPIYTGQNIAWTTDRGHLNVARGNVNEILYRLETQKAISAEATVLPPDRLLVASTDGYIYCIHEERGAVIWRFSTGEPILHTPVVVEGNVFVVTDDETLYAVSGDRGEELWQTSGVRQIVSASADRLYCRDGRNRLAVLEIASGARVGTLPTEALDLTFINKQTDRLIIGTSRGMLQCLHESRQPWPLIHHGGLEEKKPPAARPKKKPAADAPKPAQPDPDDPFGLGTPTTPPASRDDAADPFGDDPFGTGSREPGGGTSPASDAADPFGTDSADGADAADDPF